MIKMIAFDFFGVLCTPMYGGLLRYLFPGDEAKWKEWMKIVETDVDIGDISEDDFIAQLAEATHEDSKELKKRSYEYAILNQKLFNLIGELKAKYAIGLLTNAPRSIIVNILKEKISLFDTAAISADVHTIKPDPEFFKYFIIASGLMPSEVLFTDDNPNNLVVAKKLGMETTQFTTTELFEESLATIVARTA